MAQKPVLHSTKSGLNYLKHSPKTGSAKSPVLILLHGVGSNEMDLFSLAGHITDNFLVLSVRAPFTLGQGSYAWYPVDFSSGKPVYDAAVAEKSRLQLVQFIEEIKRTEPVDPKQVYLGGFSQGGIMSYSVGLTRPELLKGIVVLSGRLLDEVKAKKAPNAKLKPLRVFITHGTEDPVIGVDQARNALAFITSLGLKPFFREYPEVHTISQDMILDLVNWLKM
jgi:phospholipase/carboxylesterase